MSVKPMNHNYNENNSMDDIYNPEKNQYLPDHVAEDYQDHRHKLSYKLDAVLETPITKTLKALTNEVLE